MPAMRRRGAPGAWVLPKGLAIVHEDPDVLVVDKPPGLLTIATEREKTNTAYAILTDYVRKGDPRSRRRVFIVHRLDRESSGLLVFAKSEEAKFRLQGHWDATEKKYAAVVHGRLEKKEGTIEAFLAENQEGTVFEPSNPSKGRPCRTAYRVLKEAKDFSLLDVNLITGRKHQIRVHLAGIGHPIVGDPRYGRAGDAQKRMALHASSLSFPHPFTGRRLAFASSPPGHFAALMGRNQKEEHCVVVDFISKSKQKKT